MRSDITKYIHGCTISYKYKDSIQLPPGLLHDITKYLLYLYIYTMDLSIDLLLFSFDNENFSIIDNLNLLV